MLEFMCYGDPLSWRGNRGIHTVRCRLDRALGNEDWHVLFPCSRVDYLDMIGSDHRPVLVDCAKSNSSFRRQFRFDKRWVGKDGLRDAVESGWNRTRNFRVPGFVDKVANCRNSISWWRKNNIPPGKANIDSLKAALEEAKNDDACSQEEIGRISKKLREAYHEEEIYWKQKSRVNLARNGDKCTKFFFASTKKRRARNKIVGLYRDDNSWEETDQGLEEIATKYFNELFAESNKCGISEMVQEVQPIITDQMNRELTKEISEAEVKKALFAMYPEKAPGPDGMTALFFQRFWYAIKDDLVTLVREFFRTGSFDNRLNETNICLIPKTERPERMGEFRPISLCNVSYKIISKVLCFRLKKVLPRLISETQSAFVSGRLITDNILIAQEMFHGLRTNKACKEDFLGIKTDMSKAYDRIEWEFLEAVLSRLGFNSKWISWIMWCVRSVSYQVLLNGQPRGHIAPQRGLRQGDPLSPYLFILCTEVLIANIKKAEREKKVTGIKIAAGSPAISHLLFADDSLFFCKAEPQECQTVLDVIQNYGKASGQVINLSKSSILFGKKVPTQKKGYLKGLLGISREGGMGMYLGIPEEISGSKNKVFNYVRERMDDRVNGWSGKHLSKGGKEMTIKSVALATTSHVMSCYKLPQDLTSKLTGAISKFWWSSKGNERSIPWVAWDKMCKSKEDGGIGFHSLDKFNDALLAKQYWRLIQYPNSLIARVFKGRYFKNVHPLQAKKPNLPSFGWRSIYGTKDLVEKGSRWGIGWGFNVSVWQDPWIPDVSPRPASGRGRTLHPNLKVSHLIHPETKEWHLPILQEFLDPEDIQIVRGMTISQNYKPDFLIWHYTNSGRYTVKSGYKLAMELTKEEEWGPNCKALQAHAWKLNVPPRISHFMWQVVSGALAVTSGLRHRGMTCENICKRCGITDETINHALFECPKSMSVWKESKIPLIQGVFPSSSVFSNVDFLYWRLPSHTNSELIKTGFPWIMWYIWKARNNKVFEGLDSEPSDILNIALSEKIFWEEAQTRDDEEIEEDQEADLDVQGHTTSELKCQIDGSWKVSDPTSGLGWVCSENTNQIVVLGAKCQRRSLSPLHTELEALIWAMKTILLNRVDCQVFETDCAELVSMVQSPEDWPTFANPLDEFSSLRLLFPSFSISFISRVCNTKADCLARSARTLFSECSFVNSDPPVWATNRGVAFN